MQNTMFMVGETDMSHRVVAENYKIGTVPEQDLWTDANGKEHRSKYRDRVQGTLEMRFLSINEYQDFVFLLESEIQNDLTYEMTVYDNISEQEKEIVGFIDYEPTRYRDPGWADMMERITLTIREQ